MKRDTKWISIAPSNTVLAGGNAAALFTGLSAADLENRPFTIVRTRGFLFVGTDQDANTEVFHAAIGFAVVSSQALAIGITAVPTPETDRGSDLFFVYEEAGGMVRVSSAIGIFLGGVSKEFDSRAMRKVEDGEDVALTIESSVINTGCQVLKSGRMLLKLH